MAKLGSLVDDFSTKNTTTWGYSTGADVIGGQAYIAPSNAYPGVFTNAAWDFSDSYATIEFVSPPSIGNGSTGAYLAVASYPSGPGKVQILWNASNNLHLSWFSASNVETSLLDVPYDPVAHRYWRLAEYNGTISYQVSPDAAAWTTLTSVSSAATAVTVTSTAAVVGAGYSGTEPNPGLVIFDNFNILPTAQMHVPIKARQLP